MKIEQIRQALTQMGYQGVPEEILHQIDSKVKMRLEQRQDPRFSRQFDCISRETGSSSSSSLFSVLEEMTLNQEELIEEIQNIFTETLFSRRNAVSIRKEIKTLVKNYLRNFCNGVQKEKINFVVDEILERLHAEQTPFIDIFRQVIARNFPTIVLDDISIPEDVVLNILSFLSDFKDLNSLSLMCQGLRIAILKDQIERTSIEMPRAFPIENLEQFRNFLTRYSKITAFDFSIYGNRLTDAHLAILAETHPNLTSLNLKGCALITDEGLSYLRQMPLLRSLNLEDCHQVTDAGLSVLQYTPLLTSLNLGSASHAFRMSKITDAGLSFLQYTPLLTSLSLTRCWRVTDAGLVYLEHTPNLTSLHLIDCERITDEGLRCLEYTPFLTSLDLTGGGNSIFNITDEGLVHLQHTPRLLSLNLKGRGEHITDEGFRHLLYVPLLTSLVLHGCHKITDKGLLRVQRYAPLLTFLNVRDCHSSGYTQISEETLNGFRERGVKVARESLKEIQAASSLRFGIGSRLTFGHWIP